LILAYILQKLRDVYHLPRAELLVECQRDVAVLALRCDETETVGAVSALGHGRREGNGRRCGDRAVDRAVIALEGEVDGYDAVSSAAEEVVGDVDVLVCAWVGRRIAAMSWVGAFGSLRDRGCCGGSEKSRGDGDELHVEGVVVAGCNGMKLLRGVSDGEGGCDGEWMMILMADDG